MKLFPTHADHPLTFHHTYELTNNNPFISNGLWLEISVRASEQPTSRLFIAKAVQWPPQNIMLMSDLPESIRHHVNVVRERENGMDEIKTAIEIVFYFSLPPFSSLLRIRPHFHISQLIKRLTRRQEERWEMQILRSEFSACRRFNYPTTLHTPTRSFEDLISFFLLSLIFVCLLIKMKNFFSLNPLCRRWQSLKSTTKLPSYSFRDEK